MRHGSRRARSDDVGPIPIARHLSPKATPESGLRSFEG